MSGFLSTYAAVRLASRHPRKTVLGQLARGLLIVSVAPLLGLAALVRFVIQCFRAERQQQSRRQRQAQEAAYREWKLAKARANLARNQEAYRRRQSRNMRSTEAHARSFFGDN